MVARMRISSPLLSWSVLASCIAACGESDAGDANTGDAGTTPTACIAGAKAPCYTGAEGTRDVGRCKAGTMTCLADGSGYGPCEGEVLPIPETCNSPADDNCNGQVNESGEGCGCVPKATVSCYTGAAGTDGVGPCKAGTKTCNEQGTAYGPCVGEVLPQAETCNTPEDDDCDGQVNEGGAGCVCLPNSTSSCYSGPAGTAGVGVCKAGVRTCNAQGTGFGACVGQVLPAAENCSTPTDDNCNGAVNEGC